MARYANRRHSTRQNSTRNDTTGSTIVRVTLAPLEPLRDQMLVRHPAVSQRRRFQGRRFPHPRAGAVWLSGVHATAVTTVGAEVRLGVTADQPARIGERGIGIGERRGPQGDGMQP